jgi:predicted ATPase
MSNTMPTSGPAPTAPPVPFVKRVKIRNYKSIKSCDVELGPLTVLVGRNGSGKSNFLDALGFVADALRISPDHAVRTHGGLRDIVSRNCPEAGARPVAIELEMALPSRFCEYRIIYGFTIGSHGQRAGVVVLREGLEVHREDAGPEYSFLVENGEMLASSFEMEGMPPVIPDRLYVVNLLGGSLIRQIFDGLNGMGLYNFNPESMRGLQKPDAGGLLRPDGANVASVLGRIFSGSPDRKERLLGYLSTIVPGIVDVERVELGPWETLRFRQAVGGASSGALEFYAESMSDGTLRTLGALVAVAQLAEGGDPVRLVGIEEPETALHPAASAALMDALHEAAVNTQVVVTTHSPDLLDLLDLDSDRLLVVQIRDGRTEIGRVDRASREAVAEHLATPGELLRMDYLEPDREDLERQRPALPVEVAERPA